MLVPSRWEIYLKTKSKLLFYRKLEDIYKSLFYRNLEDIYKSFYFTGNNLYGDEIPTFLKANKDSEERSAYIIMERIFPFVQKNYLMKAGEDLLMRNVVNEIGMYGVFIG